MNLKMLMNCMFFSFPTETTRWLVGVKAEETAGGGVGARSGSDVFRDVREDEVVVDQKV